MESNYHVFFTNLANPLKMKILLCLKSGGKNVSGICKCIDMEQSKVSHALRALKNCHIVEMEQKGKERFYSLNKETVVPMLNLSDKHAKRFCGKNCPMMKRRK